MSADKMPPLPEPEAFFNVDDFGDWREGRSGTPMWTEDKVRAYAAEQVRELVEALEECAERLQIHIKHTEDLMAHMRAHKVIAKHKGTA